MDMSVNDSAVGQSPLKPLDAFGSDPRTPEVQYSELRQTSEVCQPRVRDLVAVQRQDLQSPQFMEVFQPGVGHPRSDKAQFGERRQAFEVIHRVVRQAKAVEPQGLQSRHPFQCSDPASVTLVVHVQRAESCRSCRCVSNEISKPAVRDRPEVDDCDVCENIVPEPCPEPGGSRRFCKTIPRPVVDLVIVHSSAPPIASIASTAARCLPTCCLFQAKQLPQTAASSVSTNSDRRLN